MPTLLSRSGRSASSAAVFWKAQAGFCWWHRSLSATPQWEVRTRLPPSRIIKVARAPPRITAAVHAETSGCQQPELGGLTQPLHIGSKHLWDRKMLKKKAVHTVSESSAAKEILRPSLDSSCPSYLPAAFPRSHQWNTQKEAKPRVSPAWPPLLVLS